MPDRLEPRVVLHGAGPRAPPIPREDRRPGPKVVKLVKFSKSGNHRAIVKKVKVLGNERVTAGGLIKRAKKARTGSLKKKSAD